MQGVNFRAWTRREAGALALSGWVRNEADGSVAGVIAGSRSAVGRMLAALREGPPFARVADVAAEPATPPERDGFEIRR